MTDTTFTLKQNAKRAASRMIAKGSAPSLDFEIVPQGDLFAIQWSAPIAKAPLDDYDAEFRDAPEAVSRAGSAERLAARRKGFGHAAGSVPAQGGREGRRRLDAQVRPRAG